MKKWFFVIDGSSYEGKNADEVIFEMWQSAFYGDATIEEYRRNFVQRLLIYQGIVVRSANNKELFDDLVLLQLLVEKV